MEKNITIKGFTTIERSFGNFKIYDLECAKRDLLNHFYTKKGSRVMNPQFGSILQEIIFEPQTIELEEEIINDCTRIINLDPRFDLNDINIDFYDNGYNVNIKLNYIPANKEIVLSLPFDARSENARNT